MHANPDKLLVRGLGLRNLTANIFNYTIGSGIFVLPGIVAAALGPPALLAYLLCAFIIGLVVLVFAEAGSRVSVTGGPYAYVEVSLGAFCGLIAGILLCVTDVAALAAIAMVLSGMIGALLHLQGMLWQSVLLTLLLGSLVAVNVRGVKSGARLIEICTALKLLPLFFFIVVGAFFIAPSNLHWQHVPTASQVASTAGMLIFAFAGIEAALLPSGEVRNPARTVPRAAMLALGLATIIYLLIQGVALGVLGPALGNEKLTPLAAAAGSFAGVPGRSLLLVGAGVSMFGWVTGSVLAGPRAFFALARDGFLPRRMASVHGRFHTPHVAIIAYCAIAWALALSGTFERLAILSNIAALGLYFLCAIAVVILRRRGIRTDAEPFRIPGGLLVPILACISITWVVIETITRREFIAFGITLAIAVVGYVLKKRAEPLEAR
ncbi:MAG TPA: amino acid permease [Longimicrobiales bacterium]